MKRATNRLCGWSAVLALTSVPLLSCSPAPRVRNVLIVSLDTVRADRLPAYGFRNIVTPALDRLAEEGTVFEAAFAAVPLTLPSHATLFTGLNPPRTGVRDNAGAPLDDRIETLAEIMKAQGVRTGAFVAASVLGRGRGVAQGFDTYSTGPAQSCRDTPQVRRSADAVVDDALEWLARDQDKPFFAWVHLYDAHRPYRLPGEYGRAYADPYVAAIAFEDSQIDRIMDHLRKTRVLDDTLVVIVGDHGESLGDHGEDSHGIFIYQETLRVPLILRGRNIPAGRIASTVRMADVMPTILDTFGWSATGFDGVSMLPLLRGDREDAPREVYAESLYPERFGWASLRSLRADRYKVIDAPRPELYDLESDAVEARNLFETQRTRGAAMLERLQILAGDKAPAASHPVDPALAARLAALGYVSRTADDTRAPAAPALDPKDVIGVFNQFTKASVDVADARLSQCVEPRLEAPPDIHEAQRRHDR